MVRQDIDCITIQSIHYWLGVVQTPIYLELKKYKHMNSRSIYQFVGNYIPYKLISFQLTIPLYRGIVMG